MKTDFFCRCCAHGTYICINSKKNHEWHPQTDCFFLFVLLLFRTLLDDCHLVWLDNFSNLFRQTLPDAFNGFFKECLWSVGAALKLPGIEASLLKLKKENGVTVPGMPPQILSVQQVKMFLEMFERVNSDFGVDLFEGSICVKLRVNTVPLKPEVNPESFPALKKNLLSRNETLQHFHPLGLFEMNPASNDGLYALFGKFFGDGGLARSDRYLNVLCDVNLFNRMIKVSPDITIISFSW